MHLARALGRKKRIVPHDLHAERARQLGDVPADPAESDHAHRLAAQLGALEALAIPLAAPHGGRGVGDPPHQREQQPHRMLARADGVGARRVHDRDAEPRGGGHVDRVDARAGARHDAQLRRARHQGRGDPRLAAHDQRVGAGDHLLQLRRLARNVDDFDIGCLGQQVEAAFRYAVGHDDARTHSSARPISGRSSSSAATV